MDGRVRRRSIIAVGLVLVMASAASGQVVQSENQLWFEGQYTFLKTEKADLTASGGARLGRGMDHFVYERTGMMVSLKLLPMLTVTPSYNYVASQASAGRDVREHRYAVDGTLSWHLGRFQMNDRNRFERRVLPTAAYFRYMNRFQILHPLTLGKQHINAWIADEVFYYGIYHQWSRNRFSTGISKRLSARLALDLYYLRQNDHYSHPGDINAFGVSFKAARK